MTYTLGIIVRVQGKELRKIRQQLNLTQAKFADLIGVKGNTVARWERGVLPISKTIELLAQLLAEKDEPQRERICKASAPIGCGFKKSPHRGDKALPPRGRTL